ncbi:MAG: hypothetical protein A2511_07190 [Deltaproteobacteria bacterium RIFOXYD12_FULL_50_9]|nr:MAG: hypothetical protein A2511_07190 [Deltaproteobacteria bacterium RIFOXYD12_FULL_50_9]
MSATRVEELIEEFDWFDGVYKRDEMEEALALQEVITPRLIDILETIADNPEQYARKEHYANTYAVALLAHFQEPAAHLPIIRAFCIPASQSDEIWGDMETETLPALLVQTCNGRLDTIKNLILDKDAPPYVRGSAVEAMTFAVVKGIAGREEVITFLSGLFTGTEAESDSDYWSNIVCAISDLHPAEAMPVILKAFEDGLIDPGYVGLHNVEQDLARDQEVVLAELQARVEHRVPPDVHGYLSWFASFKGNENVATLPPPINCALKSQQNKKNKNRVKTKLAKKSRKKNRR